MSEAKLRQAVEAKKVRCPKCKEPVTAYEKFVEACQSVWDGAGDSGLETDGSKATLICGNKSCTWKERTEFWESYIED
ncbi:MAG: hypothetical protein KC777_04475 [Cyanobacteria bacterium HKST-UBA02]|nr:hypothetical protein [Cyanobacteria bacterium HKST-UBA02]